MLRFHIPLRAGVAQIELPSPDEQRDAVSHGLALGAHGVLLDALETWLGESLDPVPASGGAAVVDGVQLQLSAASSGLGCRLDLPSAALRSAPPAALREAFTLRWPEWPCEVLLDSVPAERLQASSLHPGCLLLLPRSFGPAWPVQLRVLGRHSAPACTADWLAEHGRLDLRSAATASAPPMHDDTAWHIVFEATPEISAEVLLGLATRTQAWTPAPGDDAVVLVRGGRRRATGRLLTAGRGFGLRIDSVTAAEPALA